MDPLFIKHYNVLVGRFITLLNSYRPPDPGKNVEPVDAFFAFRLLLGRNPEIATELNDVLNSGLSQRQFISKLLDSPEFFHNVNYLPPGRTLLAELEGFRFWFNTGDREMGVRMGMDDYQGRITGLTRKLVRPGMHCLNIGAHYGFYACLMAHSAGESGMVHAFEPMPENFELLSRNVRENQFQGHVRTYQLASSDQTGSIELSVLPHMFVAGNVAGTKKAKAEAIRLDEVVKEPIHFIKMDIEGHEPAAIAGMAGIIAAHHPIIITEANQYWLRHSNSSANAYLDTLISFGYDVYREDDLNKVLAPGALNLDVLDSINLIAMPQGQPILAG